jgi:outer membrane protein insertion porin family
LAFPIGEKESLGFGLGIDSTRSPPIDQPLLYYNVDYPNNDSVTKLSIPLTLNWASDGKDSYFFPTKGPIQKAGLELAAPGGDLTYYRASYQAQHYSG